MQNNSLLNVTANAAWLTAIQTVLNDHDGVVTPRDLPCIEKIALTVYFDMNYPKIHCPERKLGKRFFYAEPAWILSGSNKLRTIEPYAPMLRQFSDDGIHLAGAYGPPIVDQLPFVVRSIVGDNDTRQAVLTIWRPRPMASKDIPCTVAIQFMLRHDSLYTNVFMRSSDLYLGLPYDMFTFTCITYQVRLMLYEQGISTKMGRQSITLGSAHIYDSNREKITELVGTNNSQEPFKFPQCPSTYFPRWLWEEAQK